MMLVILTVCCRTLEGMRDSQNEGLVAEHMLTPEVDISAIASNIARMSSGEIQAHTLWAAVP